MIQNVQEFFVLPINTYPVLTYEGTQIYSSDGLKEKFFEILYESPKTSPVAEEIKALTERQLVIPGFLSSGIFSFFKNKIFTPEPIEKYKYVLGFYEPSLNKVIILIENEIKVFGFGHSEKVCSITLHELTHFCSAARPSAFFTYFKKEINSYYSYVFKEIFSLKDEDINLSSIIDLLKNSVTKKGQIESNFLVNYYKELKTLKEYSTLTPNEFSSKLNLFFVVINMFLRSNYDEFRQGFRRFFPILRPLYRAYIHVLGFTASDVLCVQELVYPSEIICVASEFGTGYVERVQKILKMTV